MESGILGLVYLWVLGNYVFTPEVSFTPFIMPLRETSSSAQPSNGVSPGYAALAARYRQAQLDLAADDAARSKIAATRAEAILAQDVRDSVADSSVFRRSLVALRASIAHFPLFDFEHLGNVAGRFLRGEGSALFDSHEMTAVPNRRVTSASTTPRASIPEPEGANSAPLFKPLKVASAIARL